MNGWRIERGACTLPPLDPSIVYTGADYVADFELALSRSATASRDGFTAGAGAGAGASAGDGTGWEQSISLPWC